MFLRQTRNIKIARVFGVLVPPKTVEETITVIDELVSCY